LMTAILTGGRILMWFWFTFPLWTGILSIFSGAFWHLELVLCKSSI
jgi:hypothetical protein